MILFSSGFQLYAEYRTELWNLKISVRNGERNSSLLGSLFRALRHEFLRVAGLETVALFVGALLAYRSEVTMPVFAIANFTTVLANLGRFLTAMPQTSAAFVVAPLHSACGEFYLFPTTAFPNPNCSFSFYVLNGSNSS